MDEADRDAVQEAPAPDSGGAPLSWGLCVATLNRIDFLEMCVGSALSQSCKPLEIVIVDASDDWTAHRERISRLATAAGIPLVYLPARRKSLPAQRNQGIQAARADILFLIDDDSLLYPDAAETVVGVYESDAGRDIVAIGLDPRAASPLVTTGDVRRREATDVGRAALSLSRRPFFGWVYREILLLGGNRMFLDYAPLPQRFTAETYRALNIPDTWYAPSIIGFSLTVRRSCALAEPFDDNLLGYAPLEDADAVYRWRRHGFTIRSARAGVHHLDSALSRINRRQVTQLQLTNVALFTRKNSARLSRDGMRFAVLVVRRALAEFLRDAGARRLALPQFRGVLSAVPGSYSIFTLPAAQLPQWYERYQSLLLWGTPVPASAPGERGQQIGGD